MACCFPDSYAEAPQPRITKPVDEQSHAAYGCQINKSQNLEDEQSRAACGCQINKSQTLGMSATALNSNEQVVYNGASPGRKNIFGSTSGQDELNDELLDVCLEHHMEATRSGVRKCDVEDILFPVASQEKVEAIVGSQMSKQSSPVGEEVSHLMPLADDFTNAVDRGIWAEEGEQPRQSFANLKNREGRCPKEPRTPRKSSQGARHGVNIHRVPCSPSVAFQIQESFTSFRKELSSDFQDWKHALSSELRLLIQGLQISDETHATRLAKAPEIGDRFASSPCRRAWESGSAQPRKSEILAPQWSGTEEAAQHWKAELTRLDRKKHRCDIKGGGSDSAELLGAGTGSSGNGLQNSRAGSKGSVKSEFGKQHLSAKAAVLLCRSQTASGCSTSQPCRKTSGLSKATYTSTGAALRVTLFGNIGASLKQSWSDNCTPYYVETLYHASGIAQYVAKSSGFQCLTLVMICLSAVYMGVETYRSDCDKLMDANWKYQVSEHVLSSFFTFEILIRFAAFARKRDSLGDVWFVIDSLLVVHMLTENYVLSVLLSNDANSGDLDFIRCVRLLRIARISRLMRASPEIVTMIKAIYVGTKAIVSAVMLLLVLIYAFALALRIMNGEPGCATFQHATNTIRVHSNMSPEDALKVYFGDIPRSMWTLLVHGIFMDGIGDLFCALREKQAPFSIFLLLLFVGLSSFVVMNVLLGIFCEVVSKVAEAEEENEARSRLREALLALLRRADRDTNGSLNEDEFLQFFGDTEAQASFREHEIDAGYVMDMTDMLFSEAESEVPILAVMELLLKHRTDRPCRTGDIIGAMQCQRFWTDRAQQKMLAEMKGCLEEQVARASEYRRSSLTYCRPTTPENTNPETWGRQYTFQAMSSVLEA